MSPLICFHENEAYIYSENYQVYNCADDVDVSDFLEAIDEQFPDSMKIAQINFDAYHSALFKNQKTIHSTAKAVVFVLKSYSLLSLREIKIKHNRLLTKDKAFLKNTVFTLQILKADFLNQVELIKKMIGEGRLYQMNLTSAFTAQLDMPALQFFLLLSEQFEGLYKCLLPCENYSIISFSPELFLEKKNEVLVTQPIKGSISKNKNAEMDLLKNEKEEAELSMIVDLLRNDLNSLEVDNSAQVTTHRQLMDLNYIHHTFSEIKINTRKRLPVILRNMLPGGSISGCPKLESLIAISELETSRRQAYTGVCGWWKGSDFKLNILIRTFIQSNTDYFYFAGCGIVYDSKPEKEFEELLNKAGNLNVQYK